MKNHVLEPAAQEIADATSKPPFLYDVGVAAARKALDDIQAAPVEKPDIDEKWINVAYVPVRIVKPVGATGQLPTILYIHGGWVLGNAGLRPCVWTASPAISGCAPTTRRPASSIAATSRSAALPASDVTTVRRRSSAGTSVRSGRDRASGSELPLSIEVGQSMEGRSGACTSRKSLDFPSLRRTPPKRWPPVQAVDVGEVGAGDVVESLQEALEPAAVPRRGLQPETRR